MFGFGDLEYGFCFNFQVDFLVFEIVIGMIMYLEEYGNDVQNIIKDLGCFVKNIDNYFLV